MYHGLCSGRSTLRPRQFSPSRWFTNHKSFEPSMVFFGPSSLAVSPGIVSQWPKTDCSTLVMRPLAPHIHQIVEGGRQARRSMRILPSSSTHQMISKGEKP